MSILIKTFHSNSWLHSNQTTPTSAAMPGSESSQTIRDTFNSLRQLAKPAAENSDEAKPGETDEEFAARLQESEDRGNQPK